MLKYLFLAAGAFLVAGLIGWLPAGWLQPFRSVELKLLYLASTQGPSGADDGVQMQIVKHPTRYREPLLRMLKGAEPGSGGEEIALFFIELVRGTGEVDAVLADYGARHPDPKVRQFIENVLASPTPQEIIAARKRR